MPKVSICIPTYKHPDLLKVAVDSRLAQTFQDFEVVISDDSPDTRTEEMFRNISAKQPPLCAKYARARSSKLEYLFPCQ
jgi:glycosyltransferase involved in cell wall biosynthesis